MYRSDACIVGAATSDAFGFDLGKSPLRLQAEAFTAALADAGIRKDDVDGIVTSHGSPTGVDYEEFVLAAGLRTRWASQKWSHGRWAATTVAEAVLAVSAGLADVIAVVDTTTSPRSYVRTLGKLPGVSVKEGLRDVGGGHGEWDIHGIDAPGVATALVAQRYMDRYGATSEDLANIAVATRAHAVLNPKATMRNKPMSKDAYFHEPIIAGPFRRADYCLRTDGASCLIITSSERSRDLDGSAVVVAGMEGIHTSRDDYILFSRPGLGMGIEREYPLSQAERPRIYSLAGVEPTDIDGLYVYDSFTSNLWMVLERFGFCGEGEAPELIRTMGIGPGGRLPVNTNGGLLSEAHLSGYGHLVEMVRQLRGHAGERQLAGAAVLQWATPRGDSLILTRQ